MTWILTNRKTNKTRRFKTLEPTMSRDDATGVLQLMSRRADANVGFAWDTLTHYIEVYKAELAGC